MAEDRTGAETTRREMLQKTMFVAPGVLTLAAAPSFASAGSNDKNPKEPKEPKEPKPPKIK